MLKYDQEEQRKDKTMLVFEMLYVWIWVNWIAFFSDISNYTIYKYILEDT